MFIRLWEFEQVLNERFEIGYSNLPFFSSLSLCLPCEETYVIKEIAFKIMAQKNATENSPFSLMMRWEKSIYLDGSEMVDQPQSDTGWKCKQKFIPFKIPIINNIG